MTSKRAQKEQPVHAARPCLDQVPYRMVVYARSDGNRTPLFLVAGSTTKEMGAEKALKEAHRIHGGECFYCKQPLPHESLTIDHVEPEILGGKALIQNLVVAHQGCNAAKGHKIIESFKPDAGREWLNALLLQVQDRLSRL